MVLVTFCPTLDNKTNSPSMYVGTTYNISGTSYKIEQSTIHVGVGPGFSDYYCILKVYKNNISIGEDTFTAINGNYSYDNGNICISLLLFDFYATPYIVYQLDYNNETHLECVSGVCTKVTGIKANTCTTEGSTTECALPSYTHTFEIGLKAYSWYAPQGAADWIVTNLVGLNGVIANFFSTITGWQYVRTDIVVDGELVLIRIRMNNLNPTSISPQAAQAIPWAFIIIVTVGAFVLLVGVPVSWFLKEYFTEILQQGQKLTLEEVVILVNENIIPAQITECENNFLPSNPVGYANCVKSVVCGGQNGLTDALALQKYEVDCTTLNTNQDFDACITQYNIDGDLVKLQTCTNAAATKNNPKLEEAAVQKQLEGCIVRVPFTNSCVLYDKDLLMVGLLGVIGIGGYMVYTTYTENKSISEQSSKK